MNELPEKKSDLEIAKGILSLSWCTKNAIDRILATPWMVEYLVGSISLLVKFALSAKAPFFDIKQPSEQPTPTVQVSSIITSSTT